MNYTHIMMYMTSTTDKHGFEKARLFNQLVSKGITLPIKCMKSFFWNGEFHTPRPTLQSIQPALDIG